MFSLDLRFQYFFKSIRLFIITVWAMFTAAFAAIASFQVIRFCKNFITLFVIIKVFVFFDNFLVHKLNQISWNEYLCSMIIVCQRLLKNTKISGITLFPVILLKRPDDVHNKILINHEKIHLRQQLELLVIFFYLWYVIEYYYWYFKLKDHFLAYKSISFEREAYAMENDLNYLDTRKAWSFWKYILE